MIDAHALRAAWFDPALSHAEIARKFRISIVKLYALARQHGLPPRPRRNRAFTFAANPTPEEDAVSGKSLEYAPAVQARIRELNIGWPQAN